MRSICLILSVLLCASLLFGCNHTGNTQNTSVIVDPTEPYRLGLQTEYKGYIRLSFATLISYDWLSVNSNKPAVIARQYSLVDLISHVTEISASHTNGYVTLSFSDDVTNCEIYRWKPSSRDRISNVPMTDRVFSLCNDGRIYIYEIITEYEAGSASYLFLEMP